MEHMIDSEIKFANTPAGRKSAQEIAGEDGFWEQYIDWTRDDTNDISRQTYITQAARQGADVSPDLTSNKNVVLTADISTIEVAGHAAVTSFVDKVNLPMQPGEASWASFKCGGGPHTQDIDTVSPYVTEAGPAPLRANIPNEAGDFDVLPNPRPDTRFRRYWASLPA